MPKNPNKQESRPGKRPRRWPRRLLVLCLFLLGLALLINGPGSRWFVRKTIIDQLAEQGLEGNTTVSGQLWSGFTLQDTAFTGVGSLRTLKADHLSVRYRLHELIGKKIDLVEARGLRIEVHPEDSEEKDSNWRDTFDSLRKFHPLVHPIALTCEDVEVRIHQKDRDQRTVILGSLTHESRSDEFTVTGFSPGAILSTPPPTQDLVLTWQDAALHLDRFAVTPDLAVADLRLDYPTGDPITVDGKVHLHDSTLAVTASETGEATVSLGDVPMDLARLSELLDLSQPLAGHLDALQLTTTGLLGPEEEWEGSLALKSRGVSRPQGPLPDAVLEGTLTPAGLAARLELAAGALIVELDTPPLPFREKRRWWEGLPLATTLQCPSLSAAASLYQEASGNEPPATLPDGALSGTGTLVIGVDASGHRADFTWQGSQLTLRGQEIPALEGTLGFEKETIALTATRQEIPANEVLNLTGRYHLPEKTYHGETAIKLTDGGWLGQLITPEQPDWHPTGPFILNWSGSGDLSAKTHQGTYDLGTLTARVPDETLTNASAKGSYQWPGSIEAESLAIRNGQLELTGAVTWSPQKSSFKNLKLEDGTGVLATINGTGPGGPKVEDFLEATTPFDLKIQTKSLTLSRLRKLFPLALDAAYQVTFDTDLTLSGTADKPALNGTFRATGIRTPQETVPPLALATTFATAEGRIEAKGAITEPGGELATLSASLPVAIEKWADDPALLNSLPLNAAVRINKLPLTRLQVLAPALKDAEGSLDVEATVTGPLSEPVYLGTASLKLKNFPLPNTPYRAIRDTSIRARFDQRGLTIEPSPCTIAGGTMTLSGSAELAAPEPLLDFRLVADHALLWRNDLFVARTSGQLNLKGPWSTARLTGEAGIVDSLFYKDIEIIPLRAPSATVTPPKMPQFAKGNGELAFKLPAPVRDWPVDVRITTKDPFLVRGNLATGEATADVRVTGTMSRPLPKGEVKLRSVEAVLPFSTLNVSRGTILIQPNTPLDPVLDLRGTSTVSGTGINIYVFGPVSKPKYNLSSVPPLPEGELLALLATGATTSDLEDPTYAQMRLFQLLVDETRRKANAADAGPILKSLRRPLNAVQELNLRVAENDPFSGRKFNSATMELSSKWAGVMQIDNEGNTRGLLRYSVRFK